MLPPTATCRFNTVCVLVGMTSTRAAVNCLSGFLKGEANLLDLQSLQNHQRSQNNRDFAHAKISLTICRRCPAYLPIVPPHHANGAIEGEGRGRRGLDDVKAFCLLREICLSISITERQKNLWAKPEAIERQLARQCLPDPIEPAYLARMALFLASDDSAMCTANNYMVEAGSI
jgi:hypothetical protein